ncbi:acyl-CoA thioesterase [Giesbergeria anulus]|uniref:Acyl-CoA thioesterase FadM n=1 Tax=Giesbergeria anulus TaxID=180197 RepID=A0A1H9SB15_9BURK|nr:acyl-CoA thioesterase [Giesbergeria anulus]SER82118.1 Acyl-CoA thioesterase FadM [Giesbergeria anulus]
MARVVFELPLQFAFSTEVLIYIGHINHGQHLDNAQLLGLIGEARTRFLTSLGYTDRDAEGLAMVVGDVVVQYQSEALYGETLRIDLTPVDFNKYGFDLVFRITEASQGRAVAKGKQGLVFTDPQDHKVRSLPPALLVKLGQTPA